jgi:hypothetical protein
MSTTIFTDDVRIEGSADETQLTIQGNSSQSAPLQVWENSAGADLGQVTGDGRLQFGNLGMSTNESLAELHQDGTGASTIKRGLNSKGRFTGALSDAISWLLAELEIAGGGTITGIYRALRGKLSHNNASNNSVNADLRAGDFEAINQSGTAPSPVGQMSGVYAQVDNQANAHLSQARAVAAQVSNGSSANINTAAAFQVISPVNNGAIGTLIGLDIADINQGSDNYAIRTGVGKVKLGVLGSGLVKSTSGLLGNAVKGTDFDTPMQGASAGSNGLAGVVPQPLAGDEDKFLRGDGSWADASAVATLNDLVDVDVAGAVSGAGLRFDGTNWKGLKHHLEAVSDPSADDNAVDGYDVGSVWINQEDKAVWLCTSIDVPHPSPIAAYGMENQDSSVDLANQIPASYGTDQCTGGTASASSFSASDTPAKAFDNNAANFWASNGKVAPQWLEYDFGSNKAIRQYSLASYSSFVSSMVTSWVLEYYDGSAWQVADSRSGQSWSANETKTFTVALYYLASRWRIRPTANGGGGNYLIQEVQMMEAASYTDGVSKLAQTFNLASSQTLAEIGLWLKKFGTPGGTLSIRIETLSSGNPSGTLAHADANVSLSESSLQSFFDEVVLDFPAHFTLAAGDYAIVLSSSRAAHPSNYVAWAADSSSPAFANGEMKSQLASVWGNEGKDAIFRLIAPGAVWTLLSPGSDRLPFVDPNQHSWTQLNTGAGSFTQDPQTRRLSILGDGNGTIQIRGWYKTAPASPYSITAHVQQFYPLAINNGACIFFRESSTGRIVSIVQRYDGTNISLVVSRWNSAISINSSYVANAQMLAPLRWFRMEDDGSNRIFSVSPDGIVWSEIHSISRTDFLTADQVGFGLMLSTNAAYDTVASLLSWKES